jgi:hypothetical protein
VADEFGADLDQLLLEAQRPLLDRLRRRQGARKLPRL